ncbi:MAG: cyclase family protein [Pelotomaculum sp.]|uniref:Predicted metal-dependent hydrolase n=1 Tax=Pelotomaculum thermopropionicum (strain DSM 13744 / JCM 10971 / SI) TaxID=370438 RepID=A5CY55_PELTS|nr:cyclase family protein [Pelotomaculum sp.]BAF61076.1 predicted metal-dependent hydrolase [Pelotomaculum thermopropionicum SI]
MIDMSKAKEPAKHEDITVVEFFGKKLHFLDIGREVSPEMPHYPGHMKTNLFWHLTHEECVMRLGDTPFEGYAVKGIVTCDHVSTHVDAVYHFNKYRPDLTVDKISLKDLITPAAWIDVSHVKPLTHITLADVKEALEKAKVTLKPGMTLLYYTGIDKKWNDPLTYVSQYPGLDREATEWILDQGIVNIGTDASSLDTPADKTYPNHTVHAERMVIHTENVANITKIPRHDNFYVAMFPLKFVGATGSPVRMFAIWE